MAIDHGCLGCGRSGGLAAEVQAAFPDVRVDLIDLERSEGRYRNPLVAVATFVNGRVFSPGNPAREELPQGSSACVARWGDDAAL